MDVYIYIYIRTHTHHIYTSTHTPHKTHTQYMYMYIHIHTSTHTHTHTHTYRSLPWTGEEGHLVVPRQRGDVVPVATSFFAHPPAGLVRQQNAVLRILLGVFEGGTGGGGGVCGSVLVGGWWLGFMGPPYTLNLHPTT